jgi:nitroimidazol reductase NimA-like FMN-containing flavoprotein (pyridoxamine 5'-phosphate oxidase superfamily)
MTIENEIQRVLYMRRFAVLATQSDGQPHTSLMAFTAMDGIRHLIVATYRNTRKYRNLLKENRVAALIDDRTVLSSGSPQGIVLTIHGTAAEVSNAERGAAEQAHLARHPDLEAFPSSQECVLLGVAVSDYEVVGGIEDVSWYKV